MACSNTGHLATLQCSLGFSHCSPQTFQFHLTVSEANRPRERLSIACWNLHLSKPEDLSSFHSLKFVTQLSRYYSSLKAV